MNGVLNFGEVFRFQGQEYVWTFETSELIYTFRILSQEHTTAFQRLSEQKAKQGMDGPLYAFALLTTEEVKGRAAHYAPPYEADIGWPIEVICELNTNDKDNLIKEILSSTHVPDDLKNKLRLISLDRQVREEMEKKDNWE
jgi:hypothetical protein